MKKKEKLAIVRNYYPNAVTTIDGVIRLIDFVEEQLDLEPSQVMLADSICSDDVIVFSIPLGRKNFWGLLKWVD